MYYLEHRKELHIVSLLVKSLLAFFLIAVTFQTYVFADSQEKSIKQKSVDEYRLKGYEAQQKGNLDEALSYYVKAASLSPEQDGPAILNDMGVIYEQLGLADKAQQSYLEALRIDDHYLPTYSNLAELYKRQGQIDKAFECYKKRIEWGDPEDFWTKKAIDEVSLLGRKSPRIKKWLTQRETRDLTEEVVQKQRKDFSNLITKADNLYKKGNGYFKEKKYKQALAVYNQALSLTPENPKIKKARDQAFLAAMKGEVQEGTDSALKMLDQGDVVSAKVEFRKILTTIPDEPIQVAK